MKKIDEIFSDEYVKSNNGEIDSKEEKANISDTIIDTEEYYGTSKPTRIKIKARIAHD